MTVRCAQCQAENRDRAMFCIGCAGKLPAFAATGPSALETLGKGTGRGAPRAAAPSGHPSRPAPLAPRAPTLYGLRVAVLLLGATVLVLLAWIGVGGSRGARPSAPAPASALAALPAVPAAAAPVVPVAAVEVEQAVAPSAAAAAPAGDVPAAAAVPALPVAPTPAPKKVAAVSASARPARGAADPRVGCEHLFFAFAARCEANHCAEPAYTRHPRCTVVRAQALRDEARRNLTP